MLYQKENSIGQDFFECVRYENFFFPPHLHRHLELIHVREGAIVLDSGKYQETVRENECALVLSNRYHAYSTPASSLTDVCVFSEDQVPAFNKQVQGMEPDRTVFTCRDNVLAFARAELFVNRTAPNPLLLRGALYAVLGEYLAKVQLSPALRQNGDLFDRILRYTQENFTADITLKSTADALGYEEHYLSRLFHSRIPMHFSRFVGWYRVDRARTLLQSTDLPITEVALRSGFQSTRSFNRVYRELTGLTPTQVKRPPSAPHAGQEDETDE